jgi:hypothetical protein
VFQWSSEEEVTVARSGCDYSYVSPGPHPPCVIDVLQNTYVALAYTAAEYAMPKVLLISGDVATEILANVKLWRRQRPLVI